MKDKILGLPQKRHFGSTVSAFNIENYENGPKHSQGEWKDNEYYSDGADVYPFRINVDERNDENFYVYYKGEIHKQMLEKIVNVIDKKNGAGRFVEPLVYGQGCEKFLPYLKPGESISFELLAHEDVKELGDISKWSREKKIVVEGTDEYSLGAGTLYLAGPLKCDSAWTKLWLRPSVQEVKEYAKRQGVDIEEDETKTGLSMYGTDQKGFYAQNATTAMYFDGAKKEMMLCTTDVLRDSEFTSRVTKSYGEFILQDGQNMEMLQNLPGWTVCIEDQSVIETFKAKNPVKDSWAKKFKHFFMKDRILGLLQKQNGIFVEAEKCSCAFETNATLEQWSSDFYKSKKSLSTIAKYKLSFGIIYSELNTKNVQLMDDVMIMKLHDQINKALVYDDGCQDFVPYLKAGRCISYVLAAHEDVKELGDISKWSRQIAASP
eukprot:GHVS01023619.1.p1 GENE.GHVS01023619.1~~GHVS01023619.1.p1  ORF type:complete len:434 (+),score=21.14 GHVS01023619.1:236-1537(+)